MVRRLLIILAAAYGAVLLAGCGSDDSGAIGSGSAPSNVVVVSKYTPFPTGTPWPTFTPGPTATPTITPVPTATMVPTPAQALPRVVLPTVTPLPTLTVVAAMAQPTVTMRVLPTPYGRVWGTDAYLERQTLYASQVGGVPEYIVAGDFKNLPESMSRIARTTRYVTWIVVFNVDAASDDFKMRGVERWLDVTHSYQEPLVMFQREYVVGKNQWVVSSGLGDNLPGFWQPGEYRVELWDDRDEVLVSWQFKVG